MSETCTVEVGLLKKHACGMAAATKCANCEQPLCAKHAAPKMSAGRKLFLCPECAKAWKEIGDLPAAAPQPAAASKPPAMPPKPAAAAPKPPAPKPAAPPPAPAGGKTGLSLEESLPPLEFPEKKPGDKK